MRPLLILVALLGTGYFGLARRRFDLFSLAFFSSCVYFLPGFVGYVMRPTRDYGEPAMTPVEEEASLVMLAVLASVLLAGVLWSLLPNLRRREPRFLWPDSRSILLLAAVGGYVGFALVLATGRELLNPDKFELLKSLDRWHTVLTTFGTIAAVLALTTRRWRWAFALLPLFLLDLLIGSRTTTALTLIAAAAAILGGGPPARLALAHKKFLLAAAAVALVFFSWLALFDPLKRGDVNEVVRRASTPGLYLFTVLHSEPFTTQAILNEVVARDYRVPADHLSGAVSTLIPFYTKFFSRPNSFNDLFQPDLFPEIRKSGMANNFWAEAMAVGGFSMVAIYIAIYLLGLSLGSWCLASANIHVRSMSAIAGSYLAFLIHRNDLLFQVLLERRFLGVYLLLVVCVLLLRSGARSFAARSHPVPS